MIPRRFKRKKNCDVRTDERTEIWTDRRDSRNSYLDFIHIQDAIPLNFVQKCSSLLKSTTDFYGINLNKAHSR